MNLLSRPDLDATSKATEEARTEARVNLLSMARAVSASLIDLLTHSRSLITAERSNLPVVETQIHSAVADVNFRVILESSPFGVLKATMSLFYHVGRFESGRAPIIFA